MKTIISILLLLITTIVYAETGTKSAIQTFDDWNTFELTFPNNDVYFRMVTANINGTSFTIDEIPQPNGTCGEDINITTKVSPNINTAGEIVGWGTMSVLGYQPHKFTFTLTTNTELHQGFFRIHRIEDFAIFQNEAYLGPTVTFKLNIPDNPEAVEIFSLIGFKSAILRGVEVCKQYGNIMKNNTPAPHTTPPVPKTDGMMQL